MRKVLSKKLRVLENLKATISDKVLKNHMLLVIMVGKNNITILGLASNRPSELHYFAYLFRFHYFSVPSSLCSHNTIFKKLSPFLNPKLLILKVCIFQSLYRKNKLFSY